MKIVLWYQIDSKLKIDIGPSQEKKSKVDDTNVSTTETGNGMNIWTTFSSSDFIPITPIINNYS